jgi:uridine kinase
MIPDSTLFELDAYEEIEGIWPAMAEWSVHNYDPNMANLTQPVQDLEQVIAGHAITYPLEQGIVQPAAVIIFDSPIGRSHHLLEQLVDFVVSVDVPYEVALARRIQRIIAIAESDTAAMKRLRFFIPFYLEFARMMYLQHNELAKASADGIVDGMQEPDVLAQEVFNLIQKRRS